MEKITRSELRTISVAALLGQMIDGNGYCEEATYQQTIQSEIESNWMPSNRPRADPRLYKSSPENLFINSKLVDLYFYPR